MATEAQLTAAKEIVLQAMEKGIIIYPAKNASYTPEEQEQYNTKRAEYIGNFFNTVLSTIQKR